MKIKNVSSEKDLEITLVQPFIFKERRPVPKVDFLMVGGKLGQETMAARFYTRERNSILDNYAFQFFQITSAMINKEICVCFTIILYHEAFILISIMWAEVTQLMEGAQKLWFLLQDLSDTDCIRCSNTGIFLFSSLILHKKVGSILISVILKCGKVLVVTLRCHWLQAASLLR